MTRIYLTTTIPYVNAAPHLGFALEAVQADTLARHHRGVGDDVRLLTGTDDNSLKNVLSAEAAGRPVQDFVDAQRGQVPGAARATGLAYDDFIATSRDPRHRPGVHALWRRVQGRSLPRAVRGPVLRGVRAFPDRHRAVSRSTARRRSWWPRRTGSSGCRATPDVLRDAITSGRLRIEPQARRNEVLALLDQGLRDFSVSRSSERAKGWGITVPDDPDQVIYVWFDALGNYITSLGYGADEAALDTGGTAPTAAST